MATGIRLTGPQLRALRILAERGPVLEADHTCTDGPCISSDDAEVLGAQYLADADVRGMTIWWSIRSKGRHVLAEHDAKAGGRS